MWRPGYNVGLLGRRGRGAAAFSPADIAGLRLLLRADAIVGLVDGDPVPTWEDESAQNDVSQATSARRPTYKTAIINGLPVVRFDGTDDCLIGAFAHTGDALTVFLVARRIATMTGQEGNAAFYSTVYPHDYNQIQTFVLAYMGGGTLQAYRNAGLSAAPHPGNGAPYLLASKFDGAAHTAYLAGVAQSPVASSGSFATTNLIIGARWETNAPSTRDNFDVAEFIVYDSALSQDNRVAVESYLMLKYGL